MRSLFMAAVAVGVGVVCRESVACDSDDQCKGNRVCEDGKCVRPSKGEKTEPKTEKSPMDSGPAWSGARAVFGKSVWMSAALLIGKHFPARDDARVPDRYPHLGFGAGLQVALARDGFYFGLRWHYVPENEWSGETTGGTEQRVMISVRESNSLYMLDMGADVRIAGPLILRTMLGFGLSTSTRKFSSDYTVNDTAANLGAALQFLYRAHENAYIGIHTGLLTRMKPEFAIHTYDLFAVIGSVL